MARWEIASFVSDKHLRSPFRASQSPRSAAETDDYRRFPAGIQQSIPRRLNHEVPLVGCRGRPNRREFLQTVRMCEQN